MKSLGFFFISNEDISNSRRTNTIMGYTLNSRRFPIVSPGSSSDTIWEIIPLSGIRKWLPDINSGISP